MVIQEPADHPVAETVTTECADDARGSLAGFDADVKVGGFHSSVNSSFVPAFFSASVKLELKSRQASRASS